MEVPQPLQAFCTAFVDGLGALLAGKLYAVYLHGAWVFPEAAAKGDVDLHVFVAGRLSDEEISGIRDLHAEVARRFPTLVGDGPDVFYLLVDDARRSTPPRHLLSEGMVDESWALHRAHLLAGRRLVLHGPEPEELLSEPSWTELDDALQNELSFAARHLSDYPAYCILNLSRLIFSYQTRDVVVSKFAAAAWLRKAFPGQAACIEVALRSYKGTASDADQRRLVSEATAFYGFASKLIDSIRRQ